MITLRELDVLLLDCQSTGASPRRGCLLELGWAWTRADANPDDLTPHAAVVTLPDTARIPRRVSELTGLRKRAVQRDGQSPDEVWARLQQAIATHTTPVPAVIHHAIFEMAFINDLRERFGAETPSLTPIDTLAIARRLFPDLPRRSLRALAGYLGHPLHDALRRVTPHLEATDHIWRALVNELDETLEITTLDQLNAWLKSPKPKSSGRRVYPMPREVRLALPKSPGVYRFLNGRGDVLYVGKATVLKQRVNSYFQTQKHRSEHLLELLSQVRDVDITPTASPLEASLLETDEIKRLSPPYNRALRRGDRRLAFASADLQQVAEHPDDTHAMGPLPRWDVMDAPARLWRHLLHPSASLEPEVIEALIDIPGAHVINPALVEGALQKFLDVAGFLPHPDHAALQLVRAGTRWRRAWLRQMALEAALVAALDNDDALLDVDLDDDEAEDTGVEDARSFEDWTADDIAYRFVRMVMGRARLVRRARWLCRLSEAAILWRPAGYDDPQRRLLVLTSGQVSFQTDAHAADAPPVPAGALRRVRKRQANFDVATYDRLRVLTTELRRLVDAGHPVSVRFGFDAVLDDAVLARALLWV